MDILFGLSALVFLGLYVAMLVKAALLKKHLSKLRGALAESRQQSAEDHAEFESEVARLKSDAKAAVTNAQMAIDAHVEDLKKETLHVRDHYEAEARKIQQMANELLEKRDKELAGLRRFQALADEEEEVRGELALALEEAGKVRAEARAFLEQARNASSEERALAAQKARDLRDQAQAILSQATRKAGLIVQEADKRAQEIGGDAYRALKEKDSLEQAVKAIRNIVDGYGDQYVIPTRSLLDELASHFGHTEAGESLRAAREHSKRMVEQAQSAECDYADANRREEAVRFVVDAFNGRVDAILTRVKEDNFGTLEQEIRDSFGVVNLNGRAFRNARILPAYLDSRLAELKWAVVTQELKLKEREEQRRIQEQMREEERVRRELERAIKESHDEEEALKKAMERARLEVEHANAAERAKYEAQLAGFAERLAEAEARNQRAVSMAQKTRAGYVYIISNIGSFGEDALKIGMTRRLEPMERVYELGDASVPFEFDVHAMVYSEDAPKLESTLHDEFDDCRINKVNYRKEFFRVPLDRIRSFLVGKGFNVSFTLAAEAHEYRETLAVSKMSSEEREKHYLKKPVRISANADGVEPAKGTQSQPANVT